MAVYTLTFGEVAEHSYTSKKYGSIAYNGMTMKTLKHISEKFHNSEFYDLSQSLPCLIDVDMKAAEVNKAGLLILRGGVDILSDSQSILKELETITFSTFTIKDGVKRVNKSRHTAVLADEKIEGDDGGSHSFKDTPYINDLRHKLSELIKTDLCENKLYGEINKYPTSSSFIGFHSDRERRFVIGCRFNNSFPIAFSWFAGNLFIFNGDNPFALYTMLNPGDIYFMSDIATGSRSSKYPYSALHLKHCAGYVRYPLIPVLTRKTEQAESIEQVIIKAKQIEKSWEV